MEQIERITKMEKHLNKSTKAVENLTKALAEYRSIQKELQELSEYYNSDTWLKDFEDDCAGKLPANLPRGVLSEDAVYNLLVENQCLLTTIRELAETQAEKI